MIADPHELSAVAASSAAPNDWLVLTGFGDGPAGGFRFTIRAGQIAAFTDSPKGGALVLVAASGQLLHAAESPVEIAQMLGAPAP